MITHGDIQKMLIEVSKHRGTTRGMEFVMAPDAALHVASLCNVMGCYSWDPETGLIIGHRARVTAAAPAGSIYLMVAPPAVN